jgi:hypothetical protein
MRKHLLLATLIGDDDLAAAIVRKPDRPARKRLEVLRPELPPIDESQREAIRENRTQLLHEVEGQGGPTRTQGVQKAHLRVQADTLKG